MSISTFRCCGAKSRTNYPHGRKSKGKTAMIVEHDDKCDYNKDGGKYRARRQR